MIILATCSSLVFDEERMVDGNKVNDENDGGVHDESYLVKVSFLLVCNVLL